MVNFGISGFVLGKEHRLPLGRISNTVRRCWRRGCHQRPIWGAHSWAPLLFKTLASSISPAFSETPLRAYGGAEGGGVRSVGVPPVRSIW
jgi:hypothetical protein